MVQRLIADSACDSVGDSVGDAVVSHNGSFRVVGGAPGHHQALVNVFAHA